jgi:hypothetical protein
MAKVWEQDWVQQVQVLEVQQVVEQAEESLEVWQQVAVLHQLVQG